MQKPDGQSVKALFNFLGCGEWGLGFCFWQHPCGRRRTQLPTKLCAWSGANSVVRRYIKLCRFVVPKAIPSLRSGKLLCKIRRAAECANCKLLMERLILPTRQTAT